MKKLDDLLLDSADDEISGKKQRTKEDTEEEAEHRRWKKRVDMVRYAKTNYPMLIEFLQNNKPFFKTEHYTDRQREEMRRTCQKAYNDNIWKSGESDLALFNECSDQTPYPFYFHPILAIVITKHSIANIPSSQ